MSSPGSGMMEESKDDDHSLLSQNMSDLSERSRDRWGNETTAFLDKEAPTLSSSSKGRSAIKKGLIVALICIILYGSYAILAERVLSMAKARGGQLGHTDLGCSSSTATVPQYFQTSPQLWAGPTATGKAPFLAQSNPVSFAPTQTFAPSNPLETGIPVVGQYQNDSIFHLMAHLSPYFSNPSGFGVAEYPLPLGAKIAQVQVGTSEIPSRTILISTYRCFHDMG